MNFDLECQRLCQGFKVAVGQSEWRKTLSDLKSLMSVPDWQKPSTWLVSETCFSTLTHFYRYTKILRYGKTPQSLAHVESSLFPYDVTCQYAVVDVATARVIAAEVIVCYLGKLCKWKTAVSAWFRVFQVQYEVFNDG